MGWYALALGCFPAVFLAPRTCEYFHLPFFDNGLFLFAISKVGKIVFIKHTDATIHLGLVVNALRSFILLKPANRCRQVKQSLTGEGSVGVPLWKVCYMISFSIHVLLEQLAADSEV